MFLQNENKNTCVLRGGVSLTGLFFVYYQTDIGLNSKTLSRMMAIIYIKIKSTITMDDMTVELIM